ncbi:MAG: adaptor protein MecA [Lachnospiraceae bacterium]|jgi:negative regulator of genetic competence, sporulation and motility|nr:adaptor protein MecA [Lachnospiraceae bacterium]
MKIEKLTENKIRITLNKEDLDKKNIDFHSFMSNSVEAQDIFIDMLKEAEKTIGFYTEDYKLLLEALATADGNFILTVTRILPEGLVHKQKKLTIKRRTSEINSNLAIYKFEYFDDFSDFCTYISQNSFYELETNLKKSSLYLYKNEYYLVLNNISAKTHLLKSFCSVISEFAMFVNNTDLFERKLFEYGKIIIKSNAIKTCSKYFS